MIVAGSSPFAQLCFEERFYSVCHMVQCLSTTKVGKNSHLSKHKGQFLSLAFTATNLYFATLRG